MEAETPRVDAPRSRDRPARLTQRVVERQRPSGGPDGSSRVKQLLELLKRG
jgi:hypothetical protein